MLKGVMDIGGDGHATKVREPRTKDHSIRI